jgi:hypothetical protein
MKTWTRSRRGRRRVTALVSAFAAVGPTSGDHGFPVWYKDSAGTSMGLCLATGFAWETARGNSGEP